MITDLQSKRQGDSWGVAFTAQDEHGFSGKISHLHLANPPGGLDELIAWGATAAIGLASAGAAAHAGLMLVFSSNGNGSWDLFRFDGAARFLWWWVPYRFLGFVSDETWKPAVSLEIALGIVTPWTVLRSYGVKQRANPYRSYPMPPA